MLEEPPSVLEDSPREAALGSAQWRARVLVLAAAVLWSTSGFFVKAPYFDGWPGPVLAFWRAAFACLVLWPMVRRPQWTWRLVPMTIFFAGMNYTYLTAMVAGSAANAIWLQCTAPVWILLVGVLVFDERAIARDWLLVAFAAVGIATILVFESQGVGLDAVAWGLASSFFYAGVVLSLRSLRAMDAVWLAALNHLVSVLVLLPFAARFAMPSGSQWLWLIGLGVLQMALPYVLFAYALRSIAGHEATGIALVEPLLVPVWVYLAWGNWPDWWTLLGGGFILTGLALRYAVPGRRAFAADDPLLPSG